MLHFPNLTCCSFQFELPRHGVDQPTGRTFAMYSRHGKRVVGHGGCLGATLNLFPDDDLVVLVATTPEDAAWGTCDHTAPWAGAMYTASIQIIGAFTVSWLWYCLETDHNQGNCMYKDAIIFITTFETAYQCGFLK